MGLIYQPRWTRQPQSSPAPVLDPTNPLGKGLFASIEGTANAWDAVARTRWGTGATTPPTAATPKGVARNTTGGLYDLRRQVDGPLGAAAPWTFATTLSSTANVSLSHAFGFGLQYNGTAIAATAAYDGQYRALINYLSNYYFWGSNTDWDTGIAWDVDGLLHTAMFVCDGTTLYFYRDGVLRASASKPALVDTLSGAFAVLGNKHISSTNSPSANLLSGRAWTRALSAAEAASYAANEFQLFAPLPRRIWAPSAAGAPPTLSSPGMYGITSTGGYPRVTRA